MKLKPNYKAEKHTNVGSVVFGSQAFHWKYELNQAQFQYLHHALEY